MVFVVGSGAEPPLYNPVDEIPRYCVRVLNSIVPWERVLTWNDVDLNDRMYFPPATEVTKHVDDVCLDGVQGCGVDERRQTDVQEGEKDGEVTGVLVYRDVEVTADGEVEPGWGPEDAVTDDDHHEGLDESSVSPKVDHPRLGERVTPGFDVDLHTALDHSDGARITEDEHRDRCEVHRHEQKHRAELHPLLRQPEGLGDAAPVDHSGGGKVNRYGQQDAVHPRGCGDDVGHPRVVGVSLGYRPDEHEVPLDRDHYKIPSRHVEHGPKQGSWRSEEYAEHVWKNLVVCVDDCGELDYVCDDEQLARHEVQPELRAQELSVFVVEVFGSGYGEQGGTVRHHSHCPDDDDQALEDDHVGLDSFCGWIDRARVEVGRCQIHFNSLFQNKVEILSCLCLLRYSLWAILYASVKHGSISLNFIFKIA